MGSINLNTIKFQLPPDWTVVSTEYKNLDSELHFVCPVGHDVYSTWKKMRVKAECPICKKNNPLFDMQIIPKPKGSFRTIAIDQATHLCGFAVYDGIQLTKFGTFHAIQDTEIDRDHAIKMWLCSMIQNWQPDLIALEGIQLQQNAARNVGVTTFETLARLQGILMEAAHENKVQFVICHTQVWRAHCKVKGQTREAKKKSMQLLAWEWHGINASEDEADAIGIGKYAAEIYGTRRQVQNWE